MTRRILVGTVAGALTAILALTACTTGGGAAPTTPTVDATTQSPVETTTTTSEPTPTPTPTPSEEPSPSPTPEPLPTPTGPVWPLTGVPTTEISQTPALGVKIENTAAARPLTGVEFADNVWEETVEGGITRFVAVFHSNVPDVVEPVRSIRPMDAGIMAPLGGMIAFSGGQRGFVTAVMNAGVQTISMDRGDRGFSRDHSNGRKAPHNVIGDMQKFMDQAQDDRLKPPPAQFQFAVAGSSTAATTGDDVSKITARFSGLQTTVWDWDQKTGTFLRSDGATKAISTAGTRLAATNIVLLNVEQIDTGTVDPSGAKVMETKMVASGTGQVATGGKFIDVRWEKVWTDQPLTLKTLQGDPVLLEPGQTWIELVTSMGEWTLE